MNATDLKPFHYTKKQDYFCFCPVCIENEKNPDFSAEADSLQEAGEKLKAHEKQFHKGKPIGVYGSSWNKP